MIEPRYPSVDVGLLGKSSDGGAIVGRVRRALQRAHVPEAELKEFMETAISGDYDNLLLTCLRWVKVH